MQTTSSITKFCGLIALLGLSHMAGASPRLCENSDFEKLPTGWLISPPSTGGIFYFKTTQRLLEPPTITPQSSLGLVAKGAAVQAIIRSYKKIKPPVNDKVAIIIKGMQSTELRCSSGTFILYQVDSRDLSWDSAESAAYSQNDALKLLKEMQPTIEN